MISNLKFNYNSKLGTVDIIGKQGSTWKFVIKIKNKNGNPIDLSHIKEVRGQIRKTYNSPVIKSWICIITKPQEGEIVITLPANETKTIPAGKDIFDPKGQYVYDIEIEDKNGYVSRILQGKLIIDPEVTK